MPGPAESWLNTKQAHIPLTLCIPGIMKTDVLFLKTHPVPTYLWTFLSPRCHLKSPISSVAVLSKLPYADAHFFVWTEFQGIGDELAESGNVFEMWEGFGRAGNIWGHINCTLDLSFCCKQTLPHSV